MTLKDFYENRRDGLVSRRDGAQSYLGVALAALDPNNAASPAAVHRQVLRDLAEKADEVAATRKAMADAPTPADAEALADLLRDLIVEERHLRADLYDAEHALDEARREKDRTGAALAAAEDDLRGAERDLEDAQERQDRHDAWAVALTEAPLTSLAVDAAAALIGPELAAAQARVEGDLPLKLRTRALERRTRQQERLAEAESTLAFADNLHDVQRKNDGGVEGELAELWTSFLRAEAAFGDYVRRAAYRFDLAKAHFQDIVASPPRTAEQAALLDDDTTERDNALTAEEEYSTALKDVEQKREELLEARLEVKGGDVDLTDPEVDADASVEALIQALEDPATGLEKVLQDKSDTLYDTPALPANTHRRELDLWEAAAPDHLWDNLAAFEEAQEILTALAAGPGTLQADMTTAEDTLATKLEAHDKSERTRAFLAAAADEERQRRDYAAETQRRLVLSEVRGDR